MRMPKLRVTVTFEYDADPADYGTSDSAEMAKIDEVNYDDDRDFLLSDIAQHNFTVKVSPVWASSPISPASFTSEQADVINATGA